MLNNIGKIEHEKQMNNIYPDIYFELKDHSISFLADIRTISDKTLHQQNPKDYFNKILKNLFKKNRLSLNGLEIKINSKKENNKVKLLLPDKKNIKNFIKEEFDEVIIAIKTNPDRPWIHKINRDKVNIEITYNPGNDFFINFYSSYTFENNALFNGLKRKHDQLRKSRFDGLVGIFICDGDYDLLKNNRKLKEETIKRFLLNNKFINFVFVCYFETNIDLLSVPKVTSNINIELYFLPENLKGIDRENMLEIHRLLKERVSSKPPL